MSEDFAGFSREDLEEYAGHITEENEKQKEEIDALNGEIKDLTREIVSKRGRRGTGKDADLAAELEKLEDEIGKVRDKLSREQAETSILREKLADSEAHKAHALSMKSESDGRAREQAKRIDDLGKELLKAMSVTKNAELQGKESNKVKDDTVKETRRLLEENEIMQNELRDLAELVKSHELDKSAMEEAIAQLADDRDEIEAHRDSAVLHEEELQSRVAELEQHLEQTQEKLQVTSEAESTWQNHIEELHVEHMQTLDRMTSELNAHKADLKILRSENTTLRDSTLVGEKQREIEELKEEHEESLLLLREMGQKLEGAISDRDLLAEKLTDEDTFIEQRTANKVVAEREKLRALEMQMAAVAARTAEDAAKYRELEVEKNFLSNEVDDLTNWKAVYESGHGLQELARNQRSLKGDKRLLALGLEQMTGKYGAAQDAVGALKHAFDKLKKETGKPADFMYPEIELEQEMYGENARLQSQLIEAESQISALELENTRVRKAMKNQAGMIGEQGFKFQGMSSEMLVSVNEFASNLREGKVSLPLNDRSAELLKENRRLKEEERTMKLLIERYEREISGSGSMGPIQSQPVPESGPGSAVVPVSPAISGMSKVQEAELFGLRNDVQKLLNEKDSLHGRMTSMQAELMYALQMKMDGRGEGQEGLGLAAALIAANEALMKDLADSRNTAAGRITPRLDDFSEMESFQGAPQGRVQGQGEGQGPTRGNSSLQPRSNSQYDSAAASGGRYPRLPPAGSRKSFLSTPRGDGQTDPLFTPGDYRNPNMTPSAGGISIGAGIGGHGYMSMGGGGPGPVTPHGRDLLSRNLGQMNLPPEEWALEVKELNGQLVECLEQLYEREEELSEQKGTIASLEENLVFIKQQMAAVYQDFSLRLSQWETKESRLKEENNLLVVDRDDNKLQLRRTLEILDATADSGATAQELVKLGRKVIGHEVREVKAARVNTSLTEQLKGEQTRRQTIERSFVEMESVLKKRILYLEQYKAAVGNKMGHLQGRLDLSVPQEDYLAVQSELENLREDHLVALRREVEARIHVLKSLEQGNELRSLRLSTVHLEADLHQARASLLSMEEEMAHQKDLTLRALSSSKASSELSSVISEMARYRGEASRLEVEASASKRRFELLEAHSNATAQEAEESRARVQELQEREESASNRESESRHLAAAITTAYEGGLKADEAALLRASLDAVKKELEAAIREGVRYKELSEIASLQAQTIGSFKQEHIDELNDLREFCVKLESQGDDELLIGKLQRQLMSTKMSFKAFVKKFQFLSGNMRQRELAMRVLETRLDERERAVLTIQDTHRLEVAALKKSLRTLRNMASAEDDPRGYNPGGVMGVGVGGGRGRGSKSKSDLTRNKGRQLVSIGDKLLSMSDKVHSLSTLAEGAVAKASKAEEESLTLKGVAQDLTVEKDLLTQRCLDLEALSKGKNKQQALAMRLVALSEEVRTHKLAALQQRREIQVLRQEKKLLQNMLVSIQADVEDLEEGKVRAETQNLLMDLSYPEGTQENDASAVNRGGIVPLGDTILEYKKLRGGLINIGNYEEGDGEGEMEEGGYEERKVSYSASTHGAPHKDGRAGRGRGEGRKAGVGGGGVDIDSNEDLSRCDPEDLVRRIEEMNEVLMVSRREAGEFKLRGDRLQSSLSECEAALREMERHVTYYEGVMDKEGLPDIKGNQRGSIGAEYAQGQGGGQGGRRGKQGFSPEDQERLQEAATATMASMKQLLDEKNRAIEKYREKLEDAKMVQKPKSAADRKADALLERLTHDLDPPGGRVKGTGGNEEEAFSAHTRLLEQIEHADQIITDKDRTISQLEQRLSSQENQRERAEIRCGTALKEMDAMKGDMILLAQQLQASEGKYTAHVQRQANDRQASMSAGGYPPPHPNTGDRDRERDRDGGKEADTPRALVTSEGELALPGQSGNVNLKILELQKLVKGKNEKIKGYRDIIVRLKEEFIKVEEEKAVAAVLMKDAVAKSKTNDKVKEKGGGRSRSRDDDDDRDGDGGRAGPGSRREEGMGESVLRELRSQISALRDGLRLAKEDLEKARQTREKLNSARQAAQEESDRLESQVGRAEAQAAAAQEGLTRCRKELEETKKKEVRLRDKLKEFLEGKGKAPSGVKLEEALSRIEHLETEAEVLRTQNLILRKTFGEEEHVDDKEKYEREPGSAGRYGSVTAFSAKGQVLGYGTGGGNVLGRGENKEGEKENAERGGGKKGDGERGGGKKGDGDVRQQQHAKWETDKKLQKRITVLEERLQAQVDEVADLTAQLKKSRDAAQSAIIAKEEISKKMSQSSRINIESKKASLEDVEGLESARSKIFALEDENSRLQRRVEVDLHNEITTLRQQLSAARNREEEVSIDLEEAQERLTRIQGQGQGGQSMRDSEDRFMREERLREGLERARKQRVDLEGALLERDSQAMEIRFDLEARELDVERLKRRVRELEAAYKNAVSATGVHDAKTGTGSRTFAWEEERAGQGSGSGGKGGKRERDLEGVVEAMKKVIDKMKSENDRLRRGVGTSPVGPSGVDADSKLKGTGAGGESVKLILEKKKGEKLEESLLALQAKMKSMEESGQKVTQRQQQLTSVRKQLKAKEDELAVAKESVDLLVAEKEAFRRKATAAEGRVQQLEVTVQQARQLSREKPPPQGVNKEGKEIAELRLNAAEDREEIAALQVQLNDLISKQGQNKKQAMKEGERNIAAATQETARLREENEKLRQELSAFDLDFFEEIENLKYAHSEAVKKLRVYEGGREGAGLGGGLGRGR